MSLGVITGCDAQYEWLLPWWFNKYSAHNKYPVDFADFGMSAASRKWCEKRGSILDLRYAISKNWFKKPAALLGSSFDYGIWIDIDCEVRGLLEPIYDYAHRGLAATRDRYNRWCKGNNIIATGVIAAARGNELIKEWANRCIKTTLRGDQEVLNSIVDATDPRVIIMPREYQWLRLDGYNPKALIMHWTGPAGKKHIKASL